MPCRHQLFSLLVAGMVAFTLIFLLLVQSQHQRKPLLQPQQLADFIPPTAGPVAHIVHQSWRNADQIPNRFAAWRASWLSCFPAWHHWFWSDEDNLLLVRDKAPDFLDHYLRYTQSIQRADSVRYLYLYHYGGLYTDLDNECLQPFEHVLFSQAASRINKSIADYQSLSNCGVLLISMRRSGRPGRRPYVENSLMFARRRGHPFWLTVLEAMAERARLVGVTVQETVDLTTGPQLLMYALERYGKASDTDAEHGQVCLFPADQFNPFSWDAGLGGEAGPCRDLNRMTDAELSACRVRHRSVAFVLQFHAQSWGAGKI
ncbi:hypothetical protein BOX15_Mlig027835g1 [Macrostomum lignano]|uniref:Uncharacterized protein n=1 Tax=Macrostomum lignano TaxID=282301 RepID=A0A267GJN4_9PLAT|nr:hypothetical protein BOX15_Mlig027835g1 [Macrostomum lignano]